jgi:hypothetical protein
MSTRNIPNKYNNYFALPYQSNTDIDDNLVNQTKELMDNKKENIHQMGTPHVNYNPLYSPADLVDYGIQKNYSNRLDDCKIDGDKFDPYLNYLKEAGLNNDSSNVRYNIEYINIDSSHRKKDPYNIIDKSFDLMENPLSIVENYLNIEIDRNIKINNDDLYVGQKIIISGLYGSEKTYKKTMSNDYIKFYPNSQFVEINVNANISYLPDKYSKIDTSKMFVNLDNIVGNNLTSYVGNIPINLINKTHRIYLINTDTNAQPDLNKFYIKLPIASDGTQCLSTFNFTINFQHYNCIPINELNANYPVNNEHTNGYQIIDAINTITNMIIIKIYPPTTEYTSTSFLNFGGNSITVHTIKAISKGYPYSHSYSIELPKVYSNVTQVRLISSLFPDIFKSFRDSTSSLKQNNKLYFQDIDNGNNISVIELEEGTYTDQEFITKMETKFSELTRITDNANSSYDDKFHVIINIEKSRDYIEFNNYRKAFLKKSIVAVTPPINQNSTDIGSGTYTLTILHNNHGIKTVGTPVIFTDFIEHLGIDPSYLNKTHVISNIIDTNRYDIVLTNINLSITKNITGGGYASYILVPSLFRLLFNYTDSMGEQIGFRNIGDQSSVTTYASTITNKDLYENETIYDSLRNIKNYTNTSLTFNKNQYISISCKELPIIKNTAAPYDIFAKINLKSTNNEVLVDSIISPPVFYYNPIQRLNQLTFEFYDPNGDLYNFNNVDHSFVLEFTMVDNIPQNTGLNSNTSNVI